MTLYFGTWMPLRVGAFITLFSMNAALYAKLPYDMQKDFSPVTRLLTLPSLLVVDASSPIKTFDDLVKAARTEKA